MSPCPGYVGSPDICSYYIKDFLLQRSAVEQGACSLLTGSRDGDKRKEKAWKRNSTVHIRGKRKAKQTKEAIMNLEGRVALVTGSSRGIGRAIALAMARKGADMAVNYRSREDDAREVCREVGSLGRRCVAVGADVSRPEGASRLVREVEEGLGRIDILVNNAGISRQRPIENITEEDWDEVLSTNLKSAFLLTQLVLPGMRGRRWGRIINVSSVAAQVGGVVGPHYASSKAGLIGLTHFYAHLLAKEGITVNTLSPGPVATDMAAGLPQLTPDLVPIGRLGEPEEIADVAVTIACTGYMTGQTVHVNGGRYMS
jgi:3-oxoacyl-[acyl-carrier protein] reductase